MKKEEEKIKSKFKPLKDYTLAAHERLNKTNKFQSTKKPSNFRPQNRGR